MLDELRQRLDSEPWDEYLERLTLYAQSLLKARTWRGEANGGVPGGKEAKDFALEAVCDLYCGTRKWNTETHPSLIRWLFAVVRSEVSNAVVSRSNQERREDPNVPEKGQRDAETEVLTILEYVKDEPALYRYAECILGGCDDRADIAEQLDIPLTQVDNLRRKMRRRLDTYYGL
ncbi:MAG: hypothetical protein M3Y57_04785 [Acidobacteriota bacterium]|nr:hypothetical protein [Acidobacteriota bacterium]